jgi:hypothetical protein
MFTDTKAAMRWSGAPFLKEAEMGEVSESRLEANRANAPLSGGPRTEEGKRRSSMNASKHGLTARTIVLPKEDPEKYAAFVKEILEYWKPANAMERELGQLMAQQQWRLRRIGDIEEDLLENGATLQDLATLGIYQQRILRVWKEAKRELEEMQKERQTDEGLQKEDELTIYRYRKMLGIPWDPAKGGFVYSAEELEEEAGQRVERTEARRAKGCHYERSAYEILKGAA